jgi:YD repeat-containing protein
LIARINPLGKRWSTLYDNASRVRAAIDPLGGRTSYTNLGRCFGVTSSAARRGRHVSGQHYAG